MTFELTHISDKEPDSEDLGRRVIQVEGSTVAKPWGETDLVCSRNKKIPNGCRGRRMWQEMRLGHPRGQGTLEGRVSGSDFVSGEWGGKSLEGQNTGHVAPLRP